MGKKIIFDSVSLAEKEKLAPLAQEID